MLAGEAQLLGLTLGGGDQFVGGLLGGFGGGGHADGGVVDAAHQHGELFDGVVHRVGNSAGNVFGHGGFLGQIPFGHGLQFVHEPLAALYGYLRSADGGADLVKRYNGKLLLVFDWGGGTRDRTLCRVLDGLLVQVANDGTEEVGGDVFDEALRNEVIRIGEALLRNQK